MTDATRRTLLSTCGVRAGWDMAFFVAEIKNFETWKSADIVYEVGKH
jgi:hypothetical protein